MPSFAVEARGLTKLYGSFTACRDVNLSIPAGDVFAFIGPNGAGKTTTIRMLTGILLPSSGTAFINGIDIVGSPLEAKREMGYVPDRPFLYEKLTGTEFLSMIRDVYAVEKRHFADRREQLVSLFEMDDWMDELIENYSHGMKQKLILISAFVHGPKVIVMDEPLIGLDPKAAKKLKRLISDESSGGVTFFISTHVLSLVEEICRNVAIIDRGMIILEGPIDKIRSMRDDASLEDVFLSVTENIGQTSVIQP